MFKEVDDAGQEGGEGSCLCKIRITGNEVALGESIPPPTIPAPLMPTGYNWTGGLLCMLCKAQPNEKMQVLSIYENPRPVED